jgi:hypothetical protein
MGKMQVVYTVSTVLLKGKDSYRLSKKKYSTLDIHIVTSTIDRSARAGMAHPLRIHTYRNECSIETIARRECNTILEL